MSGELSPMMELAIKHAKQNGGKLIRKPGGFWFGTDKYKAFNTSTVEALVSRGVATYTEWRDGRNGRFPIEATLQPICEKCKKLAMYRVNGLCEECQPPAPQANGSGE